MGIIFCGNKTSKSYYLKDANINIYTFQELVYFIYNYSILITNSFISKSLIYHIDKEWGLTDLANELNIMFNKKTDIANMLKLILERSNFYNKNELLAYDDNLMKLLSLDEVSFINYSGDELFKLKKYEKSLTQYEKNMYKDEHAFKMVGYCYAKLQVYDKAIEILSEIYEKTYEYKYLKDLFFCYKLCGNINEFNEKYQKQVSDEEISNWEIDYMTLMLRAKESDKVKEIDQIFLMGENYIKVDMSALINNWKEQYRYIG